LVKQTDALTKSTTLEYDLLGRLKRRMEPDHESRWACDTQRSVPARDSRGVPAP
jgi:YD repeat-containing protein